MTPDLIWGLVGFVLTLMVFSYLFGDNFFFRVVTYLFVGVSAGYVAVLVIYQVILPRLVEPMISGGWIEKVLAAIALLLAAPLLTKISPRLSRLGTIPMAVLVGVGAAVAVGGAVFGTIFGQVGGVSRDFNLQSRGVLGVLEGFFLLLGTVGTLAYFQFGISSRAAQDGKRPPIVEGLAVIGQVFIGITLGAVFAGVYMAAMTALLERLGELVIVLANLKLF